MNSFKHAFKDRKKGEISVSMKLERGTIRLIVEDDGIGVNSDDFSESQSLGSTLINTLVSQLRGNFTVSGRSEGDGTRIEVAFPKTN